MQESLVQSQCIYHDNNAHSIWICKLKKPRNEQTWWSYVFALRLSCSLFYLSRNFWHLLDYSHLKYWWNIKERGGIIHGRKFCERLFCGSVIQKLYKHANELYLKGTYKRMDLWKLKGAQSSEKCPYSELFWSVFSRMLTEYIQSECRKMRTRRNSNTDTFHAVTHQVNWSVV